MLRLSPRAFLPAVLGLVLMGCGQSKPDQKPTPPPNSGPTAATPGTKGGDKPAETKTETATKPAGGNTPAPANPGATASVSAAFSEAAYLGDDVVGLVVANPRRVTDWDVYKLIKAEEGMLPPEAAMQLEQLPIAPEAIERVVVVFDQTFVNKAASTAGLEVKGGSDDPSPPVPTVIGTLANDTAAEGLLPIFGEAEEVDGVKLHTNPLGSALWISDDKKTILVGSTSSVVKALATKKAGKASTSKVISQINASADLSIAFALDSQAALIEQGLQLAQGVPGLGIVQQVHGLAFHINITGKPGSKLIDVVATTADEDAGKLLLGMLSPLLDNGKEEAKAQLTVVAANGDEAQKPGLTLAEQIVESATITQTGTTVAFSASIPAGFDKLPEILKPAIEQARKAAMGAKKKNNLKQIALAFHNYHDSNNGFPGAGKSAGGKAGLSWRVHLLPFIDQAPLYQQFNLDEPWDSETNKALIEQMPAIFKTEGVEEPGKTSVHVITGPGAPFAKDAAPKISAFLDGTSNTILAVEAGPDTAEIWTKPGGLDFDPKDPLKALGKLASDTFQALLCDGSVRSISIKIEAENLRRLFQLADGEVITDF
ncbi:MAG: DUF1559 domain-containing protein [Planctomycetota bacterium]